MSPSNLFPSFLIETKESDVLAAFHAEQKTYLEKKKTSQKRKGEGRDEQVLYHEINDNEANSFDRSQFSAVNQPGSHLFGFPAASRALFRAMTSVTLRVFTFIVTFLDVKRRVLLCFFICRPSLSWLHLHPNFMRLKENKKLRKREKKKLKKMKKTKMMTQDGKRKNKTKPKKPTA